jgi:hypothetical protein
MNAPRLGSPAFNESRLRIKIDRIGALYGWAIFDGSEVAATDVIPRLSRESARRAANRAARRYLNRRDDLGPLREEYTYRGQP